MKATIYTCDMCRKKIDWDGEGYPEGWFKMTNFEIEIPTSNVHTVLSKSDFCGKNCFFQKIMDEVSKNNPRESFQEDFGGYRKQPCPDNCEHDHVNYPYGRREVPRPPHMPEHMPPPPPIPTPRPHNDDEMISKIEKAKSELPDYDDFKEKKKKGLFSFGKDK